MDNLEPLMIAIQKVPGFQGWMKQKSIYSRKWKNYVNMEKAWKEVWEKYLNH